MAAELPFQFNDRNTLVIPLGMPVAQFTPRLRALLEDACSQDLWDEAARLIRIQALRHITTRDNTIEALVALDTGGEATATVKLQTPVVDAAIPVTKLLPNCSCGVSPKWCAHTLALVGAQHLASAIDVEPYLEDSNDSFSDSGERLDHPDLQRPLSNTGRGFANAVAQAITNLASSQAHQQNEEGAEQNAQLWQPKVSIRIDSSGPFIKIQVDYDGKIQEPPFFSWLNPRRSARLIDRELLDTLAARGVWIEEEANWSIRHGEDLTAIFGLLVEYGERVTNTEGIPHAFRREHASIQIGLTWSDTEAAMTLAWQVQEVIVRTAGKLFGGDRAGAASPTGLDRNYWVLLARSFYPVAAGAVRLANLFDRSTTVRIPIAYAANLALLPFSEAPLIVETNPKNRPEVTTFTPAIEVQLSLPEGAHNSRHATEARMGRPPALEEIVVLATLHCSAPPSKKSALKKSTNPTISRLDPTAITEALTHMGRIGAKPLPIRTRNSSLSSADTDTDEHRSVWLARGDLALEIIARPHSLLPENWTCKGSADLEQQLSIVPLILHIQLQGQDEDTQNKLAIETVALNVKLLLHGAAVPLSLLFRRSGTTSDPSADTRWISLDNGSVSRVPGGSLLRLARALETFDQNLKLAHTISRKITRVEALGLAALEGAGIHITLDSSLSAAKKRLHELAKVTQRSPGKGFKGALRPYQKRGVAWMDILHELGFGGILADEMGLGKTVQTIGYITLLRQRLALANKPIPPVLVISPTSVTTNWIHELARFSPTLSHQHFAGPRRRTLLRSMHQHAVVVTSYALLRIDAAELARIPFAMIVFDEAHHLKNPDSATRKAAKSLMTPRRLALTGTPTENRPIELWSIADLVNPGYLGTRSLFRAQFERPILGEDDTRIRDTLRGRTAPFILRRTKDEVTPELPEKLECVVYAAMTAEQRLIYESYAAEMRPEVTALIHSKGLARASATILTAILRLRQIVNHPLSLPGLEDDSAEGETALRSGKFEAAKDLLQQAIEEGRKILVFSQFRPMLNLFRLWLTEIGVGFAYVDGLVRDRQERIQAFSEDPKLQVFLLSLKAGGVGINLTAADTVILYDPWWNPAVEAQAVDRTHRIGQTKKVTVYRLITEDSIEEKMMILKERKRELTDALVGATSAKGLPLTMEDLRQLLQIDVKGE